MTLNKISLALIALTLTIQQGAFAQSCNLSGSPIGDLRDPLINGGHSSAPFTSAPEGQPPALGAGNTPAPVTPGMGGAPTLLPWIPAVPTSIFNQTSGIPLPVTPGVETPPGILGPALTGVVPPPNSVEGADPGNLQSPGQGSFNPAADIGVMPTGGIPGRGGYCTTIPTARKGGQETHQFELRGRNSSLSGIGSDGSQDEVTRLGPSGWGVPFGIPSGDGLRNSSIDLGGGARFKAGGAKISTGSGIQDYGLSSTRDNPLAPLQAQQSTEFGQGLRREPIYSSKTTDFGFGYRQFVPSNENPQKRGQLLQPKAVITNF